VVEQLADGRRVRVGDAADDVEVEVILRRFIQIDFPFPRELENMTVATKVLVMLPTQKRSSVFTGTCRRMSL